MATTAQYVIEQVARETNDLTSVRWTIPELCRFFNDGQRDIAMFRPDATNTSASLPLVAGTKQALPTGGEKLIAVNSNTSGNQGAVTPVSRAMLDAQQRNWRKLPGTTEIVHYCYDPREPKAFDVYPPAAASGASVDIEYARLPADIPIGAEGANYTSVTGNLSISDLFTNALVTYVLYRCYRKDTEFAANPQRAAALYQAYANDLGIEVKATLSVGPVASAPTQMAA